MTTEISVMYGSEKVNKWIIVHIYLSEGLTNACDKT